MKRNQLFIVISFSLLIVVFLATCEKDKEKQPGSIHGVIADKATGEPIRAAGVQIAPTGTKVVTGDEGQYEFTELEPGEYTLQVTKTGYTELLGYKIVVKAGKTTKGDVQIEKLPPSLRVVNDNKEDISSLDFGDAEDDLTRSFNIFNDGPESLEWEITKTSEWISAISKESGLLKAGATQAIIVTINRNKLAGGENTTTIHVTSDNGSKQLTVKATGIHKGLPTLNTLPVTDIKSSSAVFNGEITATGMPAYTERGFVYSTSPMPTIETTISKPTVAVTAELKYSATITGLTQDQAYYVRAYAINSEGTAYSTNEIRFVPEAGSPQVQTKEVSNKNIKQGTATLNGAIVFVGDPPYTERGFAYGTVRNPTIEDNIRKVATGSGVGDFSANISELIEGELYYVRAYAINTKGTAYGEEASFDFIAGMPTLSTQAVTNIKIGAGTATFNGTILSLGDLGYTQKGFVYATSPTPTIDDFHKEVSGTGTGDFIANITELAEGKTYYVRAYATNQKGMVYGNEVKFDFIAGMPTLITQTVTNIKIGAGTATFNGTILTLGDPAYKEKGFAYGTSPLPTIDGMYKPVSGTEPGAFKADMTGLVEGNTYYVRAYATSDKATTYGNEVKFDFIAGMPTLITQTVTNIKIGAGTATFNGTIVTLGDPAYKEKGFAYGTSPLPTIEGMYKPVSGTEPGAFKADMTGLVEGNTYYVRAYATSDKGTTYGNEVKLEFKAVSPSVSTYAVTNIKIGAGTATFNGTILTLGDPAYKEKGFAYGTSPLPTIDGMYKPVSGTESGAFKADMTGLVEGNTYYVRAYATSDKGTTYGNEVKLEFKAVPPSVSTYAVTNIDATTAIFNGTIVSVGDPAYTEKGFVYSTSPNPTIGSNVVPVQGTGTGAFNCDITGLTTGTIYYVKAYATNTKGTVYGAQVSFTPEVRQYVIINGLMIQKTDVSPASLNWTSAKSLCENDPTHGLKWRMPTIDELSMMWNKRYEIGGFNTYYGALYWSSTSAGGDYYYQIRFSDGSLASYPYYHSSYVGDYFYCRCVRTAD